MGCPTRTPVTPYFPLGASSCVVSLTWDMALQSGFGSLGGNCGVEPQGLGLCGCMGLWAGGLGGWTRDMGWGETALLATGGPGSGCGAGSFREMVSTALRGVGARASGAARDLPRGPGSCDCMGLWIDGLGGWTRGMGWGEAALLGELRFFFSLFLFFFFLFSQMLATDEALEW